MKKLVAAAGLGAAITSGSLVGAGTASAENFTVCPSGMSGVSTDDTSCAFADSVRRAWYGQPGTIVTAYSPVTGLYLRGCNAPQRPRPSGTRRSDAWA